MSWLLIVHRFLFSLERSRERLHAPSLANLSAAPFPRQPFLLQVLPYSPWEHRNSLFNHFLPFRHSLHATPAILSNLLCTTNEGTRSFVGTFVFWMRILLQVHCLLVRHFVQNGHYGLIDTGVALYDRKPWSFPYTWWGFRTTFGITLRPDVSTSLSNEKVKNWCVKNCLSFPM